MTSAHAVESAAGEPQVPDTELRARRTARRLLSGAGSATVTAYRVDPAAPAAYVAHTLHQDGRLLVGACPSPGSPLALTLEGCGTEVRLDVTLDAAEPGVRITAATAHLLGELAWVGVGEVPALLASVRAPRCRCVVADEDPVERVAQVVQSSGGRLGVITFDRVMLHSVSGVSSYTVQEILGDDAGVSRPLPGKALSSRAASHWGPREVLSAHEAVSSVGQLGLRAVCDAVRDGETSGWVCSTRPSVGVCSSLWDRILCVDVDAYGATLMHVTGEEITTLVVPLGPAQTAREVGDALERLAARLLPRRLLHS